MQGKSSKAKGYRGEVEFRDLLRAHGFYATREKGSLDDCTHSVPGIHFEVKRREKLDIPAHMRQATEQAGDRIPVVAFRGNRQPWRVILDADAFLLMVKALANRGLFLVVEKNPEKEKGHTPKDAAPLPLYSDSIAEVERVFEEDGA